MEGISSFEQRSLTKNGNLDFDQLNKEGRIIVVNRYDTSVKWSANNFKTKCNNLISLSKLIKWFSWSIVSKRKEKNKINEYFHNSSSTTTNHYNSIDLGPFPSNELLTSKYTIFNFLPKNLFEQFKRLANFYFLTTAILQCILPFSPVGPTTSLLPLFFVISTTAIKQAYEDYLRHKMDKEVNNRQCHVLRNKKLVKIRSKDIKVGDFVYVKNNEEIPCDMMLLATSGIHGDRCYVTTANLDGETNLKSRTCFHIKEQIGSIEKLDNQLLVIECDKPNATLYEFNGFFRVPKDFKTYEKLVADLESICSLSSRRASIPTLYSTPSRVNRNEIQELTSGSSCSSTESSSKIKSMIKTIINRIKNSSASNRLSKLLVMNQNTVPAANIDEFRIDTTRESSTGESTLSSNDDYDERSLPPLNELDNSKRSLRQKSEFSLLQTNYHEIPLDITNLLLRASRLRNTTYIYGLALYTGRDTKLARNSQVKANKFSSIERKVNVYLAIAFGILLLLSLIGCLRYKSYNYWYFVGLNRSDSVGQIFIAHFLLYNYIIPISLYVTLEFIKFFGTISVIDDKKMKTAVMVSVNQTTESTIEAPPSGQERLAGVKSLTNLNVTLEDEQRQTNEELLTKKSFKSTLGNGNSKSKRFVRVIEKPKCNSSDLNEELGLIEVLFSDKTGTLTENKMLFKACSTYGNLYRFISDQLYLHPRELYHEPVYDIIEKCSKYKTNRHSYIRSSSKKLLPNNNNNIKTNELISKESFHLKEKENRDQDFCFKIIDNNEHKLIKSKQSRRRKGSPFDHRKIPPLNKLKLINNLNDNEHVVEFFICLCLCSTITLNETSDLIDCLPERIQSEYDFQTASPDEESLITAAHLCGITMCKSNDRECFIIIDRTLINNNNNVTNENNNKKKGHSDKEVNCDKETNNSFKALVETKNSNEKYIIRHFERLMTFEFNSIRKRMSVIYRDCDNNRLLMVSKGSEELLDCINLDNKCNRMFINLTMSHFEAFAKSGLRTLLVARKFLNELEYKKIFSDMKQAKQSLNNREFLINNLYKTNETNLKLIGSTAVEDTLQEGVPETIENLKEAGIKVWLLTGDKVETAISVSYLCKLLDGEMRLLYMVRLQDSKACKKILNSYKRLLNRLNNNNNNNNSNNNDDDKTTLSLCKQQLEEHNYFKTCRNEKSGTSSSSSSNQQDELRIGLIADGRSLYYAMKYFRKEFAELCKQCQVVLGCRLSPLQKAEVVDLIKQDQGRPITAAIGDGANDVSMIQEAHVGIGVRGKEGRQAVNCSDFAINRFYMLNRLFFVHGHLFYHRTATTIHYFFYKNLLFVLPQFLYSFHNLSSAQSLYHPILLICFNLFFTSLPILMYGLFEIHIPERVLERYPCLYKLNKNNYLMRMSTFFQWLLMGAIETTISFYILKFIWGSHTPFLESGKMAEFNGFGLKLYFIIIITGTLKLYFISKNHNLYFNLSTTSSFLSLPIILFAYSQIDWLTILEDNSLYKHVEIYLRSPMFWLAIISTTMATIIPDIIWFLIEKTNVNKSISSVLSASFAFTRKPIIGKLQKSIKSIGLATR